jgi:hypothetical protein
MNDNEANEYLETQVRKEWEKESGVDDLGDLMMLDTTDVNGHKAWSFFFDKLPDELARVDLWLLDNKVQAQTDKDISKEELHKELADRLNWPPGSGVK